ncbi:MAG: hypothetical protein R3350_08360 [Saprospiraceae bacterium]|nr:hypothetical protein [Saprospiraceae bacterium]
MDKIVLILGISLLYLFYRMGRDIYRQYQCVDYKTLRDFLYRKLEDETKRRQVVRHLGHCEECREKLREIQRGKPIEDHLIEEEGEG